MNTEVIKLTLPVMCGYVPLGIAFGILFVELGYPWYFSSLMGIIIFAGAAQFMAIGLLAAGAGLFEVFISTLLLNARHVFYGLSLIKDFDVTGWRKWYLIFGLTDETYSLLTSLPRSMTNSGVMKLQITGYNQGYWIIGCTLGALFGKEIDINTQGLDFTLSALFMVLTIEQFKASQKLAPFIIAFVVGFAALILISASNMLLFSLVMVLCLLLGQYRLQTCNLKAK